MRSIPFGRFRARVRAINEASLPESVTFGRVGAAQDVRIAPFTPQGLTDAEAAALSESRISLSGSTTFNVRTGDTFPYDGRVWRVYKVYPLTEQSVGRRAEAVTTQ